MKKKVAKKCKKTVKGKGKERLHIATYRPSSISLDVFIVIIYLPEVSKLNIPTKIRNEISNIDN